MSEGITPEFYFEPALHSRDFADALVDPIEESLLQSGEATLRFDIGKDSTLKDKLRNVEFFSYFVLNPHNNGQPVEYVLNVEEQLEAGAIVVRGKDAHAQLKAMAEFFTEMTDPENAHYADRLLYTNKYLVPKRLIKLLGETATDSAP